MGWKRASCPGACCRFCLVVHHPWCSPGLGKLHTPLQLFRKVQIPCSPGSWEIPGLWVAERHPPGQMAENRTGRVIWVLPVVKQTRAHGDTHTHIHTHAHTHDLPHRLEAAQSPQQPPSLKSAKLLMSRPFQNWDQSVRKPWGLSGRKLTVCNFGRAQGTGWGVETVSLLQHCLPAGSTCCLGVSCCWDKPQNPGAEKAGFAAALLNCLHSNLHSTPWPSAHVVSIFLGVSYGKMCLYVTKMHVWKELLVSTFWLQGLH